MTEVLQRVKPRRRRQGYTDYRKRLKLVKSGLERLVIRRGSRRIVVQIVKSKAGGDETLVTVGSEVLRKYGWRASLKSVPAAYLTGLLAGKKALEKGVEKAIVDIGVYRSVKGSRLYAVVKGALDAGLEIPVSEEVLPDDDRIHGKHISDYVAAIGDSPVGFQFIASDKEYLRKLGEEVERIKREILGGGEDE
ncbi:large subunit ribosomal protein L18 [Candidatus Caldarchaeum subterraneum]|uniref:Large ribosomal subunit protein uL18 n=1 Tax=Caldiarchaeum subterraneum TaxID=311458 RepID=E6N5F3_CALS0|nr:large subunit ribosomal protein L18 [Candidatus Caldarchaeum subterraneum]BAJ49323.1 large subunit ribosomal protein L18 [Candidatus Caldarchaeum subterraneum]BAJ50338.1 large subunit ribosomal protein L18 [Candidatus Caldarchaeum subterraneum]